MDLIFLKLNLFAYLVCNGKRLEEIVAFPMNGTRANDQVICMSLFHSDYSSERSTCFDSLTKIVILVQPPPPPEKDNAQQDMICSFGSDLGFPVMLPSLAIQAAHFQGEL